MCRYKDANTAWTAASDGTLEETVYFCQNQHADVVALVTSGGTLVTARRIKATRSSAKLVHPDERLTEG